MSTLEYLEVVVVVVSLTLRCRSSGKYAAKALTGRETLLLCTPCRNIAKSIIRCAICRSPLTARIACIPPLSVYAKLSWLKTFVFHSVLACVSHDDVIQTPADGERDAVEMEAIQDSLESVQFQSHEECNHICKIFEERVQGDHPHHRVWLVLDWSASCIRAKTMVCSQTIEASRHSTLLQNQL